MKNQTVSIIIPTYKRPAQLTRAINSVINQTHNNLEVIVVDDNNPNTQYRLETEVLMREYENNPKVRYIKHEKNKNGSAARNTGARHSKGNYLMFLDDDDEFLENKVADQLNCLEKKDKSWGVCYMKYKRMKNGKVNTVGAEKKEGDLYFDALSRNLFIQAGSNLMVRREAFEAINGFDESFKRNQDLEFLVRLLKKYKIAYVNKMGLIYDMHPAPKTRHFNLEEITEHYLYKFKKEINELNNIQKNKFYRLINLQLFRFHIINRRDFSKGINLLMNGKISLLDIIRYFLHLGNRKVFKKSKGFKI